MKTEEIKKDLALETELSEYDGEDRIISSHLMREKTEQIPQKEYGLISFPTLTDILSGFVPGELTTISGLTGEGKTELACAFTKDFYSQDVNSLWFSYEVSPKYFLRRFGCVLPMFYMPAQLAGNTLVWIERKIIEAKLKYDCRIMFLDHLHYIVDMRSRNNMSLEIGGVMRALKRLAVKHNICIFLIAHLGKVKPESEPDNQDLRDSSFIAQESDNVLIIWRKENTEFDAELKVSKNRKTGERRKIDIYKGEAGLKEIQK